MSPGRDFHSPHRVFRSPVVHALLSALLLLSACGPNTEAQLTEVRALQDAGQFEASIAPLRKLISRESDHAEANYLLGVALIQTGRPSLAVWPLRKASGNEEFGTRAGLLLTSTLSRSEAYEESIRAANRVLEREPENVVALYSRGVAELSAGIPEAALASVDQILSMHPEDHLATLLRGSALTDLDRDEEAEEALKGLAERAAEGDDAVNAARKCAALGVFYSGQESNTKAAETFDRCLARYPNDRALQQHSADFYISTADNDRAVAVWRAAVDATPEDLGLRSKLMNMLFRYGRQPEALEVAKETVELFDTPEAWRMLADLHRQSGDPTRAREALEEAIERSRAPSPAIRFVLADILIDEGLYERAEEIAADLAEPSYRHLLRGNILLRTGEPAAALKSFEAGLQLYPNNAGARYLAGQAALALNDRARARAEFREAIRVSETETDAALRLAELHFQEGEYLNAFQFANRQIRKRPFDGPSAHVIAARSQAKLGEYKNAEALLDALREQMPKSVTPYLEFAALKLELEGHESALEILLESELDLSDPENREALRFLVSTQLMGDQAAEAEAAVARALAAHPENPAFLDLKGRILAHGGNRAEAERALDAALAADSEFSPALEAKGTLRQQSGDLEGALAFFQRAAHSAPKNADYPYRAGQTKLGQGSQEGALALFDQALKIDPIHVGANNDSAWLMASLGGDLSQALRRIQRAVANERNADTLDTLGYVYLAMGNHSAATAALSEALRLRPNAASIRYRLGVALAAGGEKEKAAEMLEKALESTIFPEADEARAELARLRAS